MSKHTPGPWFPYYGPWDASSFPIPSAILRYRPDLNPQATEEMPIERIVECCNALEGVENPTDALEAVKTALQEAYDYIDLDITPEGKMPEDSTRAIRKIMRARAALGVK